MSMRGRRGIICCRHLSNVYVQIFLRSRFDQLALLRLVAGSLPLLLIAVNHYSVIAYENTYGRISFRPPESAFARRGCSGYGTLVALERDHLPDSYRWDSLCMDLAFENAN